MDTEPQAEPTSELVEQVAAPARPTRVNRQERFEKLAEELSNNVPVCQALLNAGWPPVQAAKGWKRVPKQVTALLLDRDVKIERMGEALIREPSRTEKRIVGMMHERMMNDPKSSVNAAKMLSTHKSVSAQFVQDAGANVLVIQAPNEWQKPTQPAKPAIDALPPAETDLPEYE